MATMKMQKVYLYKLSNFLNGIDMHARTARARNRLVEVLLENAKQYMDEQVEIVKNMGGTIKQDGSIFYSDDKDKAKSMEMDVARELSILANETVEIDSKYNEQFDSLKKFFSDWDGIVKSDYNIVYENFMQFLEL